jgi:hypothetical protein
MYAENEILFPPYAIRKLGDARGEQWRAFVARIQQLREDHLESMALSLMMIRLDGCMSCETDSYRAMRGCVACALQTLRRFKGPDQDLIDRYDKALEEVRAYVEAEGYQVSQGSERPARAA